MLSLTSKLQTIIIYGLISFLLVIGIGYAYIWVDRSSIHSELQKTKLENKNIETDKEKAISASNSCKRALDKLVQDAKKKHLVIKKYKEKIAEGENSEKINDINDFIFYSKRLQ